MSPLLTLLSLLLLPPALTFHVPPPRPFCLPPLRSSPTLPEDISPSTTTSRPLRLEVPNNVDVSTTVREGVTSLYDDDVTSSSSPSSSDTDYDYDPPPQQQVQRSVEAEQGQIDPRGVMIKVVAPAVAASAAVTTGAYFAVNSLRTR